MRKNFLYDTPDLPMEAFQCVSRHMGGMPKLYDSGGGSAPMTDPLVGLSMMKNATTAEEALNFYKGVYQDQLPRIREFADLQKQVTQSQLSGMKMQQDIAGDLYGRYRAKYVPVEDQLIEDAQTYDSADKVEARVGRGLSDLRQQEAIGQQMMNRNIGRYGVTVNPTALALINSRLAGSNAAAAAGLSNNIRTQSELTGMQLRSGIAGMGRGAPGAAVQATQGAAASGNAALGSGASTMDQYRLNAGLMGQGFGMGMQGYSNAANIGMQDFRNRQAAYQYADQSDGNALGMIGGIAGMAAGVYTANPALFAAGAGMTAKSAADGGPMELEKSAGPGVVRGRGDGISDEVVAEGENGEPIRISNGEYIIPADVVAQKGKEFFDKLIDRYHTPAAVQRAMKGRS